MLLVIIRHLHNNIFLFYVVIIKYFIMCLISFQNTPSDNIHVKKLIKK